MKSKGVKIVLIIFLIIIVIAFIGTMVFVMVNKDRKYSVSFLGFGNKTKTLLQNEYDINKIKNIEVTAKSTNVKFVEGNSDKVLVTIYGKDGDSAKANLNSGKLEIDKENNRIYILALFMFVRDEIVVELPKIYNGDVNIHVTSGNIEVLDLENANMNIETSSGNISCGNMKDGEIKATSGNIKIGNGKDVTVKLSSGNIKAGNLINGTLSATSGSISAGEIKDAKISVTSGSIRVGKSERITAQATSGGIIINEIDGFCDLSCKSGGIKVERCFLNENSKMQTTSGGIVVKETNDIYVDAKTTSGGIKVERNNRTAEIELKLEATSGGIKVNV